MSALFNFSLFAWQPSVLRPQPVGRVGALH